MAQDPEFTARLVSQLYERARSYPIEKLERYIRLSEGALDGSLPEVRARAQEINDAARGLGFAPRPEALDWMLRRQLRCYREVLAEKRRAN